MISETRKQPHSWAEWRRLRAWELSLQGWTVGKVAAALGVTTELSASGSLALARQARPLRTIDLDRAASGA